MTRQQKRAMARAIAKHNAHVSKYGMAPDPKKAGSKSRPFMQRVADFLKGKADDRLRPKADAQQDSPTA